MTETGLQAKLRRLDGRNVAAGAATDHDNVELPAAAANVRAGKAGEEQMRID